MIELNVMKIEPALSSDFPELIEIWERSVRGTHDFLSEQDIQELKPLILTTYFPQVQLFKAIESNTTLGFIGIHEAMIEMLFIDADQRAQGVGKQLVEFVIDQFDVSLVDVNEQNSQAVGFYQHLGFQQIARSALDGQGKPYPILHLRLGI